MRHDLDSHFSDAIWKLDFPLILARIAAYSTSDLGRENVRSLHPSTVYAEVRDELDRVREMSSLLVMDEVPDLQGISDIRPALHHAAIEGSILSGETLYAIFLFLATARRTYQHFYRKKEAVPLLSRLAEQIFFDKAIEYHIDRVIEEGGRVKDNASKELREIRREIIEKSGALRRKLESILKRLAADEYVQEDLITLRDGRMVLPVKAEFKHAISGFIHSSSASGQTVYIEPAETLELNNELRELEFLEQREVQKILAELTDRIRGVRDGLVHNATILAELDSLLARVRYAAEIAGTCALVTLDKRLEIEDARHPILLMHKQKADVVPLSVQVGGEIRTIVITGPNAGGKSVAMKTVGLLSLMTQSGIPIPAGQESSFPVYERISVDIGDEQSVENDLSTFSSHVKRLSEIVDFVNDKTLVIIDEIGTGTDPSEGSALGAAILDYLTNAGAHTIATTHHGMLKAFAEEHPHMQNALMEFDVNTLEPTYRFRAGLPGSSYAFEITSRIGMKPRIVDRARELLGSETNSLEHLLSEVEKRGQFLVQQTEQVARQKKNLDALVEEYQGKVSGLRKELQQRRREANEEARELIRKANATIEDAVRQIRETQAAKEIVRKVHRELEELRDSLDEEIGILSEGENAGGPAIRKNDRVMLKENREMQGIVLEEERDGILTVLFGSVKLRIRSDQLLLMAHPVVDTGRIVTTPPEPAVQTNEIDIRGMYGDEAVRMLETFLYEAYAAGLSRVDVIHGKGTGALRKRVHEYLKGFSLVERFHLAQWNEGGSGMTVVIFKS